MRTIQDKSALRQQLSEWRRAGERIAIVPTMGSLHAGHLSLVSIAKRYADRLVVTLFVNPTQFADGEDFERYPRSLQDDCAKLAKEGADVLFAPEVETIYPFGIKAATRVVVPGLTDNFCGASRPSHFDGVTSVLARLFALVQPDIAVFGQKDYQQQLVVRRMVEDLNLPIDIQVAPIIREADGLAMSSRNAYLGAQDRELAGNIYRVLDQTRSELLGGRRDFAALEAAATESLAASVDSVEYFAVREAADLAAPDRDSVKLVVLVAAHLSGVRLIDNVLVDL